MASRARTPGTLALAIALAACGFQRSGTSGDDVVVGTDGPPGGADAAPIDAVPGSPVVAITAPTEGAEVHGSRTITVEGTIVAEGTVVAVAVVVNGGAPVAATFDAESFTASVPLSDLANAIEVTVTDDGDRTGTANVSVRYPFVALADFAPAALVLGQLTFTARMGGGGAGRLRENFGRPWWTGDTLFIGDFGNNRGLGLVGFPSRNGEAADLVLGQSDFVGSNAGDDDDESGGLQTFQTDDGTLWASDADSNRLLVYDPVPADSTPSAAFVVGQTAFNQKLTTCDAIHLSSPEDFTIAGGKLVVADAQHNRVLIWNALPTDSGDAADVVLGQGDFTHCTANDDNQMVGGGSEPTARTLDNPTGVWTDGTRLIVTDQLNARVLIWNTVPTMSFTDADVVLGQDDFTSNDDDAGADGLSDTYMVDSNGNQLAVCDSGNSRVLVWNQIPTANRTAADVVLGQFDFDGDASNDDDHDGNPGTQPTARTMDEPGGVRFVRDTLIVADTGNSRYLVFGTLPCDPGEYETPPGSGECEPDPCVTECPGDLCRNDSGAAECL